MDLLSAVMHHMGLQLRPADSYSLADRASRMFGHLTTGERRLLPSGQQSAQSGQPAASVQFRCTLAPADGLDRTRNRERFQQWLGLDVQPSGINGFEMVSQMVIEPF